MQGQASWRCGFGGLRARVSRDSRFLVSVPSGGGVAPATFGSQAISRGDVVDFPQIPKLEGPWTGLSRYRQLPQDLRWKWGDKGICSEQTKWCDFQCRSSCDVRARSSRD